MSGADETTIGPTLRAGREWLGLSIERAAATAGVSVAVLAAMEADGPIGDDGAALDLRRGPLGDYRASMAAIGGERLGPVPAEIVEGEAWAAMGDGDREQVATFAAFLRTPLARGMARR